MSTAHWTVEVVRLGDPAQVELGIGYTDGFTVKPVRLEVPLAILTEGATSVARYFIQHRRMQHALRGALDLSDSITFSE